MNRSFWESAYGGSALCGCNSFSKCSLCYISMILEWCQPCKWADPNSGKNTRDLKTKWEGWAILTVRVNIAPVPDTFCPVMNLYLKCVFIKMCQALSKWKSFWHNLFSVLYVWAMEYFSLNSKIGQVECFCLMLCSNWNDLYMPTELCVGPG